MTARTHTSPNRSRRIIFLLCFLAVLADGFDLIVYGSTLPAIQSHPGWHVSTAAASTVGALALVGVLIGAIASGILSDRFGRKALFLLSIAVLSLGTLGCAVAPSFPLFGALRFVTGLGIGGLLPTAVAIVAELADPLRRSRTLGLTLTGTPIGGALAGVASLRLLPDYGFRPVYAIGAASLLLLLPAARLLPESVAYLESRGRRAEAEHVAARFGISGDVGPGDPTAPAADLLPGTGVGASVRRLFARGVLGPTIGFWIVMLAVMLTNFGITTWLPQALRSAGFSLGSAETFLIAYTVGAVVGTLIGATVADRLSAKRVGAVAFTLGALGLACLGLVHTNGLLLAAAGLAGLGIITTQVMLNDHIAGFYPTASRATGLGWALGVGRIGAIAGPAYGSLALTTSGGSLTTIAVLFATPAVIGAVVLALLPRHARTRQQAVGLVPAVTGP